MQEVTQMSSDILTKGRQTFFPFLELSVTTAQALNTYNFFKDNGIVDCQSLIGWLKGTMECFGKHYIVQYNINRRRREEGKDNKQMECMLPIYVKVQKMLINGMNVCHLEYSRYYTIIFMIET
ncbi:unnamed protein product [Chrysodeixis includens]|uniref:Uncharacterized protein n=1 Tax=Chrysodeixis includens TaxID=689277 RepID=A0A9N8KYR6_CHRIL|nr:unnamed protein product [Chrysodeixis includens]